MNTAKTNKWTRREFTAQSALAMLSGVVITITGCSDDSSPAAPTPTTPTPTPAPAPAPAPPPAAVDVAGVVSANHGHAVVVTGAQLTAGNALMNLDITGNANHPHSVSLTAAEVGQIAGGTRVQKASTNNSAHAHTVTFN